MIQSAPPLHANVLMHFESIPAVEHPQEIVRKNLSKLLLSYLHSINILLFHICSTMEISKLGYRCHKSIPLSLHAHHSSDMHSISKALYTLRSSKPVITLVKSHTECSQHRTPANLNHKPQDCYISDSMIN